MPIPDKQYIITPVIQKIGGNGNTSHKTNVSDIFELDIEFVM
jgi:hypothetical protein